MGVFRYRTWVEVHPSNDDFVDKKYVWGIDAGGTQLRLAVVDTDAGTIVSEVKSVKAEQFRILKENFSSCGQYGDEDKPTPSCSPMFSGKGW